jgi:uncharacterized protein YbbK (DUF523 family)
LVSACLVGRNCKYNAATIYNAKVVEFLRGKETLKFVRRCCGAGARGPARDTPWGCGGRETEEDCTRNLNEAFVRRWRQRKGRISRFGGFAIRSPTCSVHEIYDGSFTGKLKKGSRLFAKRLREAGFLVVDASDIGSLL